MASGGQNGPLRAWQKKGAFRPGLSWCNVEGESGLSLERAGSPSLSASGALGEAPVEGRPVPVHCSTYQRGFHVTLSTKKLPFMFTLFWPEEMRKSQS